MWGVHDGHAGLGLLSLTDVGVIAVSEKETGAWSLGSPDL